jgi:hypothetical protein
MEKYNLIEQETKDEHMPNITSYKQRTNDKLMIYMWQAHGGLGVGFHEMITREILFKSPDLYYLQLTDEWESSFCSHSGIEKSQFDWLLEGYISSGGLDEKMFRSGFLASPRLFQMYLDEARVYSKIRVDKKLMYPEVLERLLARRKSIRKGAQCERYLWLNTSRKIKSPMCYA